MHRSARAGMGFSIKQTGRSLTPHCFPAQRQGWQDRLQLGMEGREIQVWALKQQPKPTLCFCLGQAASFPGGLSAVPEHAGHEKGIKAFLGGRSSAA